MSMKPTVINADTEKLQRLFNEATDKSLEKYQGEQWKLYYKGFSDAIGIFVQCFEGYEAIPQHIQRILGDNNGKT